MELSGHPSAWGVVLQARTHLERLRRIADAELGVARRRSAITRRLQERSSGDAESAVSLLRSHIRQIEGFIGRVAELHAGDIE